MFNATLKRFSTILLIATLAGLAGCSNPEENRSNQISEALQLSEAGAHEAAIATLEAVAEEYPNDPEILQAMARVYTAEGDNATAAFFLEQAYRQNPENIELLYKTYKSMEAAGQPSGETLEELAERSPESLTKDLWVKLGAHRSEKNETESALNAYLKGVDPEQQVPAPETAAAIGQLFSQLENYAQAENWLGMAADNDSPSALTALFSLFQIQLIQKDWTEAEAIIAQLDKQFPGALEASEWKQDADKLKRWRADQEKMKAELAAKEAEAEEEASGESAVAVSTEKGSEGSEGEVASEGSGDSGKSQVIADLEAAEALADTPAEEAAESGEETDFDPDALAVEAETGTKNIEFNPEIAIAPADPDWSIEVDYDEENTSPETSFSIETSEETNMEAEELVEPEAELVEPLEEVAVAPDRGPKTLEELFAEAESAEVDRNYKAAIRKYWAAIGIDNSQADVWNLLSRAYLLDGQLQNADTTALEAVRLNPREVAYTLDFLRVAQRSRPPEKFLTQLETAYNRFPTSPEITLSLARAHERISEDRFTARNLYLRFIDLAPNHPLRTEAETAVARLR